MEARRIRTYHLDLIDVLGLAVITALIGGITYVSAPSATADIEMTHLTGGHSRCFCM
jgi:hypothetical protein